MIACRSENHIEWKISDYASNVTIDRLKNIIFKYNTNIVPVSSLKNQFKFLGVDITGKSTGLWVEYWDNDFPYEEYENEIPDWLK